MVRSASKVMVFPAVSPPSRTTVPEGMLKSVGVETVAAPVIVKLPAPVKLPARLKLLVPLILATAPEPMDRFPLDPQTLAELMSRIELDPTLMVELVNVTSSPSIDDVPLDAPTFTSP